MQVTAHCRATVAVGSNLKVLLTWQRTAMSPEEYCWLNVFKDREDFTGGKTYRITIEEETPC